MAVKDNPDSRFLHAEDLLQDGEWKQYQLTISKVIPPGELKYKNGQMADCRVLCFKETAKMFSLSAKCNCRVMPYATGSADQEKWVGRRITVYPSRLEECFGERDIACVRVRAMPGAKPKLSRKDVGVDLTGTKVETLQAETKGEKS